MENPNKDLLHSMIEILGTKLSLLSKKELLKLIRSRVMQGKRLVVASGNIQSFNLAYKNRRLQLIMNTADVVRIDGAGLRLGARLLGVDTPHRMTWADLAWDLARLAEENGFKLYLLGNSLGMAEKAAKALKIACPDLHVVGCMHGYFQKESKHPENTSVINNINLAKPDIMIVGLGMPIQEYWVQENMDHLDVPVIMTAGAAFEWIVGVKSRAPQWMLNYGLEWLWRLWIEPRRLFKRYIIGNPLFLFRVLWQRIFSGRPKSFH